MSALLKQYIMESLAEMQDHRVPNQLVPKGSKKQSKEKTADKETEEEIDETNVVANIMGFSGPLGVDSEDMKGPGAGPKKKKSRKSFVRWK